MDKLIDCSGQACPRPVINAKKAVDEFTEDGRLTVRVDNETAVANVTKMGRSMGFEVTDKKISDHEFEVYYEVKVASRDERSDEAQKAQQEIANSCAVSSGKPKKNVTVVLSSRYMGTGDEKLGTALMKGYIFALTNLDPLPDTVLAYNGGAYLTTEGSESLEDLRQLEGAGVTVKTCGTCLDFYGLKEKLAVGSVTNMYDIVETMAQSDLVIRP